MYDDFFFPYEKAKLWTRDMILLSLSNFLLYASLYIMLPVLPLWIVRHWACSYAEAGAAIAVFGLAMFLPGPFNSYLIDTFKRKSVCFIALLFFVAASLLYPYVATIGLIALVRAIQGGLFSVITMTTGSTLVIDVTPARRRTDANIAFAWAGRFGMAAGLALGIYIYPYWNFIYIVYTSMALGALALILIPGITVPFRAPLSTPLFSLDRFILPRTLWPGLNMMMISFIFGILIAHIYNELFYICILAGLVVALLLSRYVLSYASARAEVELGQAALVGGLLLLGMSNSLITSYLAGVLVGIGVGVSTSRFFIKMISLPRHCERGTGNNTYQLLWEVGILGGFLFENMWTEMHPDTIYWICICISVAALVMYEFFTHPWYYRRMEEKQ
jgi:MFS family permease